MRDMYVTGVQTCALPISAFSIDQPRPRSCPDRGRYPEFPFGTSNSHSVEANPPSFVPASRILLNLHPWTLLRCSVRMVEFTILAHRLGRLRNGAGSNPLN